MIKTPEEMAEEWISSNRVLFMDRPLTLTSTFLAGYEAAEKHYKLIISQLETKLKSMEDIFGY